TDATSTPSVRGRSPASGRIARRSCEERPPEVPAMSERGPSGQAQTVLGPVNGGALGVTLPHEHLLCDITCFYVEPEEVTTRMLGRQPVTLQNRGWVHYHWTSNLDNLCLWDETSAVAEARHLVLAGGRTVVDPTNVGLGRDPLALVRVARATGLQIIMGSGHYVDVTHSADVRRRSDESISAEIARDVTVGVKDTGIRAGLIGEIGCSWPWTESERKCMRGAVHAQRATGAPLM